MLSKVLFCASLLRAAVALPGGFAKGGKYPGYQPLYIDANFDDLPAAPLDLEPVGYYDYLYYNGFSVGTEYVAGVQLFGVKPHTPPNVAYSDVISSTFAGPSVSVEGEYSKTKAFDLTSFYYACVGVTVNPTTLAENCTITVTGYRGEDLVATQTFQYGEDKILQGSVDAPMDLGEFDDTFKFLTSANFTYVQTETVDAPFPAFLMDDLKYTAYVPKKYGKSGKGGKDGKRGKGGKGYEGGKGYKGGKGENGAPEYC